MIIFFFKLASDNLKRNKISFYRRKNSTRSLSSETTHDKMPIVYVLVSFYEDHLSIVFVSFDVLACASAPLPLHLFLKKSSSCGSCLLPLLGNKTRRKQGLRRWGSIWNHTGVCTFLHSPQNNSALFTASLYLYLSNYLSIYLSKALKKLDCIFFLPTEKHLSINTFSHRVVVE